MLAAKPWKLDQVVRMLLGIFICFCGLTLVGGLLFHSAGKGKPDEQSLAFFIYATLALHGPILFWSLFFVRMHHIGLNEAFGFLSSSVWKPLLYGLLATIAFFPLGEALQFLSARVLALFHIQTQTEAAVEIMEKANSAVARIYLALFAVVIAPVAEEMLFRGILYPAIKQLGRPRLALWGTSLAFAAVHQTIDIFVPLTFLAVVLTLLYERTGNLLAPISAHSLFNGIGVLQIFLGDSANARLHIWFPL